ncbi:MAG: TldD/PmbA family protein [Chloroflexi bacterium]|nr:TldD/PmbA family protein [Chloroflexota bacterium]
MEKLLARAAEVADEAEVYWVSRQDTPVLFEANRLKSLENRDTSGLALRIIKNGRLGHSSTNNTEDVDGLIARVLETVPFGAEAKLEMPSTQSYPHVDVYDPQVESISFDDMVQLGQSLIDGIRSRFSEVLCEARIGKSLGKMRLINSRGCDVSYKKTSFGVSVEGSLIRDTDMLFVGEGRASCRLNKDLAPIISDVLEQLELGQEIVTAPSGDVPIIFTPRGVASILVWPLMAALNGKTLLQGASPLEGKLGQRVLAEGFSLWDDPTTPYASGSRLCDDEGVPSRPLPLINKGVLSNFLYDLQTAGQARKASTGSASRSLGSLPAPSSSVILVGEGDVAYKDMLSDVKEGIIIDRLLGAGQSNILGGDFKANVLLGYKIEKGRIVGRVKNTMVSGNVYEILNDLRGVGSEAKWVWGYLKAPHIYCGKISVATSN